MTSRRALRTQTCFKLERAGGSRPAAEATTGEALQAAAHKSTEEDTKYSVKEISEEKLTMSNSPANNPMMYSLTNSLGSVNSNERDESMKTTSDSIFSPESCSIAIQQMEAINFSEVPGVNSESFVRESNRFLGSGSSGDQWFRLDHLPPDVAERVNAFSGSSPSVIAQEQAAKSKGGNKPDWKEEYRPLSVRLAHECSKPVNSAVEAEKSSNHRHSAEVELSRSYNRERGNISNTAVASRPDLNNSDPQDFIGFSKMELSLVSMRVSSSDAESDSKPSAVEHDDVPSVAGGDAPPRSTRSPNRKPRIAQQKKEQRLAREQNQGEAANPRPANARDEAVPVVANPRPANPRAMIVPDEEDREYVEQAATDVLLGRGTGTNDNPGNQNYLDIIEANCEEYGKQTKTGKSLFAKNIVRRLEQEHGIRFLQRVEEGPWFITPLENAVKKTMQALREFVKEHN